MTETLGEMFDAALIASTKLVAVAYEWQPIETAPKNGMWVLLLVPKSCQEDDRPVPWIEMARWVEEFYEDWEQVSETRKERRVQDRSHWSIYETPTHWMPRPTMDDITPGARDTTFDDHPLEI